MFKKLYKKNRVSTAETDFDTDETETSQKQKKNVKK